MVEISKNLIYWSRFRKSLCYGRDFWQYNRSVVAFQFFEIIRVICAIMAGRSTDVNANANANVVRQLLSRLHELSSAISSQNVENGGVENEVRNVFNDNRRPVSSNTNSVHRSTACAPRGQAGKPTQPIGGQPLQRPAPNRHIFMARRNFSGQRPSNSSRRRKKPSAIDSRPFMRDLILLAGPDDNVTPRQGTRLALMEKGHMISGCKFTKGMNAAYNNYRGITSAYNNYRGI